MFQYYNEYCRITATIKINGDMDTRYVNTLFFLLTFNKVVNLPFLYPLKMSENLCWSLVLIKLQAFRYRNGTLPLNGLIHKSAISLKLVFLQYFFRKYLPNYAQEVFCRHVLLEISFQSHNSLQ